MRLGSTGVSPAFDDHCRRHRLGHLPQGADSHRFGGVRQTSIAQAAQKVAIRAPWPH